MIKMIFSAVAAALFISTTAFAQESLVIAAGNPKGGYAAYANSLAERLNKYKIPAAVQNYSGSAEIAAAICSKEAVLGPVQMDAVYTSSLKGCAMEPIAVYGAEYAMILFPPDSDYSALSDLGKGNKILVDAIGSGSELSLQTMIMIEKGPDGSRSSWSEASLVNGSYESAPAMAQTGVIDAAFMVVKLDNPRMLGLVNQGWSIGDISDKDINDLLFNGKPLYEKVDVNLKKSWFGGADNGVGYKVNSIVVGHAGWQNAYGNKSATIADEAVRVILAR